MRAAVSDTSRRSAPPARRPVTLVAYHVGPVGGMERAIYELARGLLAQGFRVQVIARACDLEPAPGLRWIRVPGPARPAALAEPLFFLLASLLVLRHRAGLLHALGAIVANRVDVATVQFCHHAFRDRFVEPRRSRDSLLYRLNERVVERFARLAERWAYDERRTRHLVPVSRGVAGELAHYFAGAERRCTVVPNGVDFGVFGGDPSARRRVREELELDDALVAAFVGGDWARKGLAFAIQALAGAPEWTLLVVGTGDRKGYAARARELGVADRVRFLGHRADPAAFYAAADAFVLPTAYEAHPLVVLEAAASGCPILATPVNGVEEVLRDGVNGWRIERDAGTIAARLNRLAEHPDERRALGRAAADSVRPFDWPSVVQRYVGVYEHLAEA
jgi:UDP-glucose:(heptosyl)LPS alpha-1,3-glucosyltransferase